MISETVSFGPWLFGVLCFFLGVLAPAPVIWGAASRVGLAGLSSSTNTPWGPFGLLYIENVLRIASKQASLPRSLASLKREILEKKWVEAQSWAGGRISKAKYRMPKSQKPDGEVADYQEARLKVLPAEDGPCPDRTIPTLG